MDLRNSRQLFFLHKGILLPFPLVLLKLFDKIARLAISLNNPHLTKQNDSLVFLQVILPNSWSDKYRTYHAVVLLADEFHTLTYVPHEKTGEVQAVTKLSIQLVTW